MIWRKLFSITIILFLTVPLYSQGFSFKKQKQSFLQEQGELIVALKQQREEYYKLKDSCDKLIDQVQELTVQSYERYGRLRLMKLRIRQTDEQLDRLKLSSYKDTFKSDTISLEKESEVEAAFLNEKKAFKKLILELAPIVPPVLTDLSRKEQLLVLQTWNNSSKIQLLKESELLKSTKGYLVRVQHSMDDLNNQLALFPQREKYLNEVSELLNGKLNAARDNYAKNGPNGFYHQYGVVFPDVVFSDQLTTVYGRFDDAMAASSGAHNEVGSISSTPSKAIPVEGEIYQYVDEPPSFPDNIRFYMKEHLIYPDYALENGLEGKSYVSFIVSSKGAVSAIEVKRGVPDCPECDAEAIRLVENMPKWNPGKIDGKPVNCWFTLPVIFKMD